MRLFSSGNFLEQVLEISTLFFGNCTHGSALSTIAARKAVVIFLQNTHGRYQLVGRQRYNPVNRLRKRDIRDLFTKRIN